MKTYLQKSSKIAKVNMPYKYAFYIHHHGAGHLTRALAIAAQLPHNEVVFFGSSLATHKDLIPEDILTIELPFDTPIDSDWDWTSSELNFLHYAPLNVKGIVDRNYLIINFFAKNSLCLLIVDVSVEIALLARLCGIPTVVVRQHGDRSDTPHSLAYESASLLLAPYAKSMAQDIEKEFMPKTFYSGGFSKYSGMSIEENSSSENQIAIFFGQGGTCFDWPLIAQIRRDLPQTSNLHILGTIQNYKAIDGVSYYGNSKDAYHILKNCGIVISNAGHNCIMELGDLRKKIICIPAERPFEEQKIKVKLLENAGVAKVVEEKDLLQANWLHIIENTKKLKIEAWEKLMNPKATFEIATQLKKLHSQLFKTLSN
ncbi:glycosyltransferase [Sphingobacterium sp. UBA1498]|uniref:glycosyltransferase n=1 Tax=Sphingobacterium sp. UBA1498 TaxID=1947481 RepID=UPI0025D2AB41|nr:glycosyltransferase [Sphingobacterium sp. UBA1498]